MPCYDSRDRITQDEMRKNLDNLTRLLCLACGVIFENETTNDSLSEWWLKHKVEDLKRERHEENNQKDYIYAAVDKLRKELINLPEEDRGLAFEYVRDLLNEL